MSVFRISATGSLTSIPLGPDPQATVRAAIDDRRLAVLGLGTHLDMWHDGEGLYRRDPQDNHAATAIAHRLTGRCHRLFGPVVLAARTDSGIVTGLSNADKELLHSILTTPHLRRAS